MQPKRWDPLRFAGIGALALAIFAPVQQFTSNPARGIAFYAGSMVGGVVVGALVGGLIAVLRNLIVRAR